MFPACAAAACVVVALAAVSVSPRLSVTDKPPPRGEIGAAAKFDCVFGKKGASSKLTVKLASKDFGEEGSVFDGHIWLDKKPLFGESIKFLYSKTEDGKTTLGAGVLTQKRKLYYTELFISYNPQNGEATFEAATAGVSTTLQGACTLK